MCLMIIFEIPLPNINIFLKHQLAACLFVEITFAPSRHMYEKLYFFVKNLPLQSNSALIDIQIILYSFYLFAGLALGWQKQKFSRFSVMFVMQSLNFTRVGLLLSTEISRQVEYYFSVRVSSHHWFFNISMTNATSYCIVKNIILLRWNFSATRISRMYNIVSLCILLCWNIWINLRCCFLCVGLFAL